MRTLNIFKPGNHTASSGATLSFSDSDVRDIADNYDPAVHEAPITIGHPKDNLPAYGWIQTLAFSEDTGIEAIPYQLNADFEEMVSNKAFKKISASFYTPTSLNNPTPGSYYLRHVAFLGAQAPAVKGLRDAEFNDQDGDVVEFTIGAYEESTIASMFRRLREWIISKEGVEEADKVISAFSVEELEASARQVIDDNDEAATASSFTEHTGDDIMNEAELKAANDKLTADQAEFAEQKTALETQETDLKARKDAMDSEDKTRREAGYASFADELIDKGIIAPARKLATVAIMAGLDGQEAASFAEGSDDKTTPLAEYKAHMLTLPKIVDYAEHAGNDKGEAADMQDANENANLIRARIKKHRDETGAVLSFADAATQLQNEAASA